MKKIKLPKLSDRRKHKWDSFVFSSWVRYARNIEGLKFPAALTEKERFDIDEKLCDTIKRLPYETDIENLDDMHHDRIMAYVADLIVTEDFVRNGRKLVFETSGDWVILFNEEDHLRLFGCEAGYNIKALYSRLTAALSHIEESIDFAYDETWGYLTSNIQNMGTGLRFSVVVNLRGLAGMKRIELLMERASGIGYRIENFGGEDSDSALFYVSNSYSMGITEEEMLSEFESFVERLYELEMSARQELFGSPDELELSFEEIFDLGSRERIEYDNLLYYVSLVDSLNRKYLLIEDTAAFRELVWTGTDNYFEYETLVEPDKITKARMETFKKHLDKIKYKAMNR